MQKEELSDSRNRQAAGNGRPQNEDQIWQRVPSASALLLALEHQLRSSVPSQIDLQLRHRTPCPWLLLGIRCRKTTCSSLRTAVNTPAFTAQMCEHTVCSQNPLQSHFSSGSLVPSDVSSSTLCSSITLFSYCSTSSLHRLRFPSSSK
jgi:hypothetical protein